MPFLDAWHEASVTTLGLFWMAFWAFGLGYLISSMIQVFVTRKRMQELVGTAGVSSMVLATLFGFISSSCSFAALAGARSLFTKGASLAPSLAFLLASTNLVIELGILIAVFLSWPFVLGEYVGGVLLILCMWVIVFVSQYLIDVEGARQHAREQEQQGGGEDGCHHHHNAGHELHNHGDDDGSGGGNGHCSPDEMKNNGTEQEKSDEEHGNPTSGSDTSNQNTHDDDANEHRHQTPSSSSPSPSDDKHEESTYAVLTNIDKWKQVAMTYCMEWQMGWKDVTVGFTVAGVIAAFVPREFFEWLFIGTGEGGTLSFGQVLEQTIVGPIAAFFTFIGSMGNIPLAAVLYSNGVSFAGIMAFIFSDLVVFPILRINAKFYGWGMALYILGVFWACLIVSTLVLYYAFDAIGILPSSDDSDPVTERDFFDLNYTFGLNVFFIMLSVTCLAYYFYKNGLPKIFSVKGQSIIETTLTFLAWVSYLWLIGGLVASIFS